MNNNSVYKALLRGIERQTYPKEKQSRKKKNDKPEKLVEKDVLAWCEKNNISMHVIESKAVYSATAGRYLSGKAEPGFPDLVGNNKAGLSMYVELKAKDRRSNLSIEQYEFLLSKIKEGCFAVVVDSDKRLEEYYFTFLNSKSREGYLKGVLPVPKALKKIESRDDPHGLCF
ncbi:MAG: hypothetical protein KDD50_16765 [Bdellovibrionales bacterium]|nr:hypothetical protein [Bdellovibrionales bacterium]